MDFIIAGSSNSAMKISSSACPLGPPHPDA
jgi:hypothetical protein